MTAMHDLEIREEAEPDAATREAVGKGLGAYNETRAGPAGWNNLWWIARDGTGAVQAGLRAYTAWRWLFVQWLWVAEPYRRAGTGSRLLARAEEYARAAGGRRHLSRHGQLPGARILSSERIR
jgi:GNAT superfamily N-acetyltransferase